MKNNKGQGLVEYLILLCLISVSAIAVVSTVGKNIKAQYANISNAITGKGHKVKTTDPSEESYQGRGMDDFSEGAKKQD